jgi:hypothetical protein
MHAPLITMSDVAWKPFGIQGLSDIDLLTQKLSSTIKDQCTCEIWAPRTNLLQRFWSKTIMTVKVNVTLTFDPANCEVWGPRAKGPGVVKLLVWNCFYKQGECNLELWPLDPKINSDHLLAKTNAHEKFDGKGPMGCKVIDWKSFWYKRLMWPWPLTLWLQKQKATYTSHHKSPNQVKSS